MIQLPDHYEFLETLAEQGNRRTLLARQKDLDRLVVIKSLDAASFKETRKFVEQGRLVSTLSGTCLAGIHDFGQTPEGSYVASAYIEGMNLEVFLDRARTSHQRAFVPQQFFPEWAPRKTKQPTLTQFLLEIFHEICQTLDKLHNLGSIHRNLKPSNIILDPSGRPHLTDFSQVRDFESQTGSSFSTDPEAEPYRCPELGGKADFTADIFSVGALLKHALEGQTLSKNLGAVLARATAQEAGQRYGSIDQMSRELLACLYGQPVLARNRFSYFGKRVALACGAILALGMLAWILHHDVANKRLPFADMGVGAIQEELAPMTEMDNPVGSITDFIRKVNKERPEILQKLQEPQSGENAGDGLGADFLDRRGE